MTTVLLSEIELMKLERVRVSPFRCYVILKAAKAQATTHSLACGIYPDGAQTTYSNKPNRYQMQMMLWQLWTAELVELMPINGADVLVAFPLADRAPVTLSGIGSAWVKRGKAVPPVRPPVPLKLRKQVLARDGHKCVTCGATADLTADHIHPVARGGETTLQNLQTLCRRCNSRKGARGA